MGETFQITREIGIDMAHRVPDHESQCRHLHGHRYQIKATCEGPLVKKGAENGMVMDFGFLKEEMMSRIHYYFDHGMTLFTEDPFVNMMTKTFVEEMSVWTPTGEWEDGFHYDLNGRTGKQVFVPFIPTAENLARCWFDALAYGVDQRTSGRARLVKIQVWETPNNMAEYTGGSNE